MALIAASPFPIAGHLYINLPRGAARTGTLAGDQRALGVDSKSLGKFGREASKLQRYCDPVSYRSGSSFLIVKPANRWGFVCSSGVRPSQREIRKCRRKLVTETSTRQGNA